MTDRQQPRGGESERIGAAIRATAETVAAPEELRARIAADASRPRRRLTAIGGRRQQARSHRPAAAVAALASLAAIALAVGLIVAGDDPAPPSVAAAAAVALQAPTQTALAVDARDDRFLAASVGAVRFPNYGYESGWTVAGARRDELSSRRALTVVYGSGSKRIGYTVLDGPPVAWPAGARTRAYGGRRFGVLRSGGALVVTWREGGHTCVLASRHARLERLLALAAWS